MKYTFNITSDPQFEPDVEEITVEADNEDQAKVIAVSIGNEKGKNWIQGPNELTY